MIFLINSLNFLSRFRFEIVLSLTSTSILFLSQTIYLSSVNYMRCYQRAKIKYRFYFRINDRIVYSEASVRHYNLEPGFSLYSVTYAILEEFT